MKSFLASPKRQENPVGNWGEIPLPVQRMIARRGLFQMYFSCHPKDPIAMEVLRHLLTREDISDFLKLYRINKALLTQLAREARFFKQSMANSIWWPIRKPSLRDRSLYRLPQPVESEEAGRFPRVQPIRSKSCPAASRQAQPVPLQLTVSTDLERYRPEIAGVSA